MKKKIKVIFQILFVLTILLLFFSMNYIIEEPYKHISVNSEESSNTDDSSNEENKEKSYIKWVEFNITFEALDRAAKLDISSHVNNEEVKLNWIEILAYISTKYGGDFKKYKAKDIDELVEKLRNGETIENLTKDMKNYSYFYESIEAVLGQYIGNYFIEEEYEAGIELLGTEIKSVRKGSIDISDAYVRIKDNEAYIINMFIEKYEGGSIFNHEPNRERKLLLHKKEIKKIYEKVKKEGFTLIPLKVYIKNEKAKILIGICKGKKLYDKRESIKIRDLERENKNRR